MPETRNVTLTKEGTSFMREGLNISWPFGRPREVAALPEGQTEWSPGVIEATLGMVDALGRRTGGRLQFTDEPATAKAPALGVGVARILPPDEARAWRALPAGPVMATPAGVAGPVELTPAVPGYAKPTSGDRQMPTVDGPASPDAVAADTVDLESMTKGELLIYAQELGVDIPSGATKADIVAALENAPAPAQ